MVGMDSPATTKDLPIVGVQWTACKTGCSALLPRISRKEARILLVSTAEFLPDRPAIPFTIRQLECFVAAADSGSITAAAAMLHASDSAVSDAVTAMERAMGASLFHRRRSKGVNPTSDGLAVLPIARRLLAQAEEIVTAVGPGASSVTGPVRIGSIPSLAPVILPRLLAELAQQFPNVRVEIVTADLPDLRTALDGGEIDLILTLDVDVPPEYRRQTLGSTEAVIVVAADDPLAGRERATLDEVADRPMILLDIAASRAHTLELMSSRGIVPRIVRRVRDYELCRALVGRGIGYTLLMRRKIDARTWDGGRLAIVAIDPPPRRVEILLVWPHDLLPVRVATVIDVALGFRGQFDLA
jgi:DNA-binding transcriptional LysR family regulator